ALQEQTSANLRLAPTNVLSTRSSKEKRGARGHRGEEMSHLRPTLPGDDSRIALFLKALRYGRHEQILPEFFLTVKNLSFAPGGPYRADCPRASRGPPPSGPSSP